MKIKLVAGSAVAATVLLLWSWLFWSCWPGAGLVRHIENNERFLSGAIETNIDEAGAYRLPHQFADESDDAYRVRLAGVPVVLMFADRGGREPDVVTEVGYRWVVLFGASLVAGLFAAWAGLARKSWREALAISAAAGLSVTLFINLSYPTLFWTPWSFFIVRSAYDVTTAVIASMILRTSLRFGSAT